MINKIVLKMAVVLFSVGAFAGPDIPTKNLHFEQSVVQESKSGSIQVSAKDLAGFRVIPGLQGNTAALTIFEPLESHDGGESQFAMPMRNNIEQDLMNLGVSPKEVSRLRHRAILTWPYFYANLNNRTLEALRKNDVILNRLAPNDVITINYSYEIVQTISAAMIIGLDDVHCVKTLDPVLTLTIDEPSQVLEGVVFKSAKTFSMNFDKSSASSRGTDQQSVQECLSKL